jgi:hypothetical protein
MTDAAVALVVLDAALAAWDRGVTPRRGLALAALGAVAVWISHPSVFVLAAAGATLFLGFLIRGRRSEAAIVAAAGAAWVASFAVEYVVQLRGLRQNEFLVQFWTRGYLPFPPRSMGDLTRYANLPRDIFSVPFEDYSESSIAPEMSLLAAGLWLAGLVALAAERRFAALAMLASPLAITAVVAMTGRYPISGRMILFLAGPILLTMAAGLAFLLRSASRPDRRIGAALLALTAFTLVEHEVRTVLKTSRHEGARDVLEWVARDWREGDTLQLHWAVQRPFEYYRMTGLIPGLARIEPLPPDCPPTVAPRGRTWTVFDRHATLAQYVPVEQTAHELDRTGRPIGERRSGTAIGLLHEPR